ncbi:disease resistance protein RPS2-like isoform X2 [Macadamia integrifolia]|uniref:disease resistance protein RPS2-like isoform X2 n=1 Tax=Macadamia integrifolia TaxID=60698 RepID=UPI001C4EE239|nr:disease resistance protein RPS2-like isoform X2 [Macadamia integrifolia]
MAAPPTVVPFRWNVFLSFRGEDTRHNFTSDLYDALVKEGVKTFKDDEKLRRGDLISEALEKAIQESRISIIIFSRNYANSRWCLQELTLIMERWEKHGQKVFPIFLEGVDPLDVQNQKGSFGEPVGELEKRFGLEKGERWRSALRSAAQLSGWSFTDFGDEEKLIQKIVRDIIQYNRKKNLLTNPVIEIPNKPIIEYPPSTERMLQQIFDCISDPDPRFGIIGLYGRGGVGKTTMAREVNNRLESDLANGVQIPFETVIMVTVSATPNILSIKTYINKRLGLPNGSEVEALFDVLKKKKFLLILDDVWSELKLEDVGIPRPPNDKGSKLLVTSRIQKTCIDMGATTTINVQPLSESESWDLFVEKAGKHVAADDIKPSAEKIVQRCRGLPLAIVVVARAMANRHGVEVWENALRELKQSAEHLQDYNIGGDLDEMLDYWVGEGLVDQFGSLKAARDKGEELIQSLKIVYMLEDGEEKGSVRVHDNMRALAIWVTSSEYSDSGVKFLIRTGKSVKEAPLALKWVGASRISLMDTQIKELPELGETCQKLTAFLFRKNRIFTVVPSTNFLQHMGHLRVLDLSESQNLEYLPDSLSCLVNLRVLRLHMCKRLRALPVPVLGMLLQLQVLDLGWCSELDQQILGGFECKSGVSNLRYLDVKFSKVRIPEGVISRLYELEELRFYASNRIKWRVSSGEEDVTTDENESASDFESIIDVRELCCLINLTSLTISFEDIIISDWFKPLANKITALSLNRCTVEKQDAIEALNLDKSQNLWQLVIDDCPGVKCVRIGSLLTVLKNCKDLELVLDRAEVEHDQYFLHELHLVKLPKLKGTWVSLESLNCFGQLSKIVIEDCHGLRMVFTKEMPRLFNNLKELRARYCVKLEVIIETEKEVEVGEVISLFPRLEILKLEDLPTLADVSTNQILHCPLIREVNVSNCLRLKKDPLRIRNKDGLLVIEGEHWKKGNKVMEEEIQASQ